MALGLRQLRYFVVIADAGALSRAAEILNIAQSALSHHVAELEADLGLRLFDRRARGVALTAAGKRLYDHAGAIMAALDRAEADVRTFTETVSGPVAVGFSHTAVVAMALPFMWAVRNRCPDVHLTLVEGLSPSLVERVLSGNLDLAVAYNPPRNGRLTVWPLLIEDLFLVGRPEIIGESDAPIAFADIPQKEVLGLYPIPASRAIIQAQILRNQITPSPTLEIDSLNSMRLALESGLGCAILAKASVGAELVSGRIHARRIVEPEIERTLSLIALADRPQTRAFDEVRRAVIETASREVAEGRWIARPGDGIPIKSI